VVFTGRIAHEQVPGVYELVDLFVYPRKSMRLTELVTPLKPLEAMAMRKACLASNVGGHQELIQDGVTGALFPAGNVDALAQRIDELIGDATQLRRMGEAGRSWVNAERTWTKSIARYEPIYEAALASANRYRRATASYGK
jgi:glycosyltransferase involved in cell wall biosynthesis